MRRFRKQRLLSLLLVLAVGVLQALGAVRGYACDCADTVRLVQDLYCGGTCHPGGGHHDHDDHGPAGHTHQPDADGSHEHHEVRGSVDAAGTLKAASSELTAPPGVAVLPPEVLLSVRPVPRILPSSFDSGPPPPLLVARAVVRQV